MGAPNFNFAPNLVKNGNFQRTIMYCFQENFSDKKKIIRQAIFVRGGAIAPCHEATSFGHSSVVSSTTPFLMVQLFCMLYSQIKVSLPFVVGL